MTPDILAEAKRLEQERTKGPWEWEPRNRCVVNRDGEIFYDDSCGYKANPEADAAFIAFCGTHFGALLVRLETAEKDLAGLNEDYGKLLAESNAYEADRDRLVAEVERLTKEAVDFGTAWHHAEKMAANEMRCRVANQDAVRHQAQRAEQAEAEVTRLKALKSCEWTTTEGASTWESQCGNEFTLAGEGPMVEGMKFCCFCGGTLSERITNIAGETLEAQR